MDRCLLDTDMLSELFRGRNAAVRQRAAAYIVTFARLTVAAPTWMEIVSGYQRVDRPDKLAQFVSDYATAEVLPLDKECASLAGRIYGDLVRTGKTIGLTDCMIAAIAIHHDLSLVTGNTDHYRRVQDAGYALKLENWREDRPGGKGIS